MPRARAVVAVCFALAVALVVAALIVGNGGHRAARGSHPTTTTATPAMTAQAPDLVAASQSPVQVQTDQQLAQSLGSSPAIGQLRALAVPAPAITGGWPRLAVATTPEQWATEFVTGLLDVGYRGQSRVGLGQWLMAEEAGELLPGIPAPVAGKILYSDVFDPQIGPADAPPIPSPAQWASDAKTGVRQSVSNLLVQADPNWQQLVNTGWQPADARMDSLDVSGLLTVTNGAHRTVQHFTVAVSAGSAAWHPGYGTVALGEWQVSR